MPQTPTITAKDWLMIGVLGVTWGATFLAIEIALEGITPFWLAAARIGFASLLLLAFWTWHGLQLFEERPGRGDLVTLFVIGAFNTAAPFMLLSWGQQFVTSGFAGVSMAAIGLMVLPLAHFFVPGEGLTVRKALGFTIGFFGVILLIGGDTFASTGLAQETAGRFACLGATGCYAVSTVLIRRLAPADPIGLAAVVIAIGACVVIPVAWLNEGPPPLPDTRTIVVLALLGLIPTAAANLLRIIVIRSAGPVFMSLTSYQVPVWSVVFGAAVLGEPLPASLLVALALILAGIALSQYGALKRLFGD